MHEHQHEHEQWTRDGLVVTTDPARFDVAAIHAFLANSYWAKGRTQAVVERSIRGSLCFGLLDGKKQVGFARAITDAATYAYLADVYILESHRGRGLATWLMECVMAHRDLQGLRRFTLVTKDAHDLYKKFGFEAPTKPERYMEILKENA
jgi:GNAT superfamily N-acetyltransferase